MKQVFISWRHRKIKIIRLFLNRFSMRLITIINTFSGCLAVCLLADLWLSSFSASAAQSWVDGELQGVCVPAFHIFPAR